MSRDSETDYYLIESGTALKLFKEWEDAAKSMSKKRGAFLKRIGVEKFRAWDRSGGIAGVLFDDGVKVDESLWRRGRDGAWVPRKATPEGKVLYKEMSSYVDPSYENMCRKVIGVGQILCGLRMHWPGLERIGKKPVICLADPWGEKGPPKSKGNGGFLDYEIKLVDGVRKLKRSEFWAMKEAEKPTPPPTKPKKAVAGVRKKVAALKAAKA